MKPHVAWLTLLALILTSCTSASISTATPTAAPTVTQLPLGIVAVTPSPTAAPTATSSEVLVTISDIERSPDAYRDRHVLIQGYGIMMATLPLCPGYVGLDRRSKFVDAQHHQIVAEVKWKPPQNVPMYDPDNLRLFEGHIRVFSGQIGCTGTTTVETFAYFEIVGVK